MSMKPEAFERLRRRNDRWRAILNVVVLAIGAWIVFLLLIMLIYHAIINTAEARVPMVPDPCVFEINGCKGE